MYLLPPGVPAVLLEKFKDKASVVNKAAMEALLAMARYCFALADIAEDIAAALAHQNPKVKEGTLSWLTTCIVRETKQAVSKLMPVVVPAAAKCTNEGAPSIRDAAFGFLVQAALKVRWPLATSALQIRRVQLTSRLHVGWSVLWLIPRSWLPQKAAVFDSRCAALCVWTWCRPAA